MIIKFGVWQKFWVLFSKIQVELVGHSMMDYVHPDDHRRLARQMNREGTNDHIERVFYVRMKQKIIRSRRVVKMDDYKVYTMLDMLGYLHWSFF